MVKRKLKRRELKEDEVFSFFEGALKWGQKNLRILVMSGIALVVIGGVYWGVSHWVHSRNVHASRLLAEAIGEKGVKSDTLKTLVDRYGSTRAGRTASILLDLQEKGDVKAKVDALKALFSSTKDDGLRILLMEDMVTLLLDEKKTEDASTLIASLASSAPEDLVLYLKGRVAETAGKWDEAKKLYDQLAETHKESTFANMARLRSQNI